LEWDVFGRERGTRGVGVGVAVGVLAVGTGIGVAFTVAAAAAAPVPASLVGGGTETSARSGRSTNLTTIFRFFFRTRLAGGMGLARGGVGVGEGVSGVGVGEGVSGVVVSGVGVGAGTGVGIGAAASAVSSAGINEPRNAVISNPKSGADTTSNVLCGGASLVVFLEAGAGADPDASTVLAVLGGTLILTRTGCVGAVGIGRFVRAASLSMRYLLWTG
jgi:hypothetical protein